MSKTPFWLPWKPCLGSTSFCTVRYNLLRSMVAFLSFSWPRARALLMSPSLVWKDSAPKPSMRSPCRASASSKVRSGGSSPRGFGGAFEAAEPPPAGAGAGLAFAAFSRCSSKPIMTKTFLFPKRSVSSKPAKPLPIFRTNFVFLARSALPRWLSRVSRTCKSVMLLMALILISSSSSIAFFTATSVSKGGSSSGWTQRSRPTTKISRRTDSCSFMVA
mmetsp:Transcript_76082/g.223054  ORF Transcript_76082/g.223054 Transcript_76082/m.223054 type:complete len:218 (-) Transcript_76082:1392-2045(-)